TGKSLKKAGKNLLTNLQEMKKTGLKTLEIPKSFGKDLNRFSAKFEKKRAKNLKKLQKRNTSQKAAIKFNKKQVKKLISGLIKAALLSLLKAFRAIWRKIFKGKQETKAT
ncbi:MAG: hypothetical protein J6U10_07660, partial [Lachnospiraceae bacterium]|nr:hypothetical protein [Lachnospiraceae bacterium]